MHPEKHTQDWQAVYTEYIQACQWLESRIVDKHGSGSLRAATQEEIRAEQHAKMKRVANFLNFLHSPQEKYQAIHVTGTSGKGSVSTLTTEILHNATSNVGLHTSPYVQVPIEKIILNGEMIKPSRFTAHVHTLETAVEQYAKLHTDLPNYGELWTILAHEIFAQEDIQWGVFEVGMGGRFDASNIINTAVSIITNVDLDHVPQLGLTVQDIAWHKAGIIKLGKPVITGVTQPDLLQIISQEAQQHQSQIFVLGKDFRVERLRTSSSGIAADLITPFGRYDQVQIGLSGAFQATNAVIAVTAAHCVAVAGGFTLSENHVRMACESTTLPGRFEVMQQDPLVVLDGAHNPAKMRALAHLLSTEFPDKEITLVVGMLATKDVVASLGACLPLAKHLVITQPHVLGKPAMDANQILRLLQETQTLPDVIVQPNVHEAISHAIGETQGKEHGMVVVTGSVYMLGEARSYWYPQETYLRNAEYRA